MTAPMNSPAGREGMRPSVSANDEMAGRPGTTEPFGEEVRRRRESAGLTQVGLATAAGVSLATVQSVEHGQHGNRRSTTTRIRTALDRVENPQAARCGCADEVDVLATELAEERAAHQQTLATLRAIRALLDSHGGLQ